MFHILFAHHLLRMTGSTLLGAQPVHNFDRVPVPIVLARGTSFDQDNIKPVDLARVGKDLIHLFQRATGRFGED